MATLAFARKSPGNFDCSASAANSESAARSRANGAPKARAALRRRKERRSQNLVFIGLSGKLCAFRRIRPTKFGAPIHAKNEGKGFHGPPPRPLSSSPNPNDQ